MNITEVLAAELNVDSKQVANTLALFAEDATVPFIARYRKERTGGLDEIVLRQLHERHKYLSELQARKEAILKSIEDQGKLTDELRGSIEGCTQKAELEDLYLPYKPKRRTRATAAKEKGLEPLAEWIKAENTTAPLSQPLEAAAASYVDAEKGVETIGDALQGAADIIAEEMAETAELRAFVRQYFFNHGQFSSSIGKDHEEGSTQFENYRKFEMAVKDIPAHNMLALRRGESEGIVSFTLSFDEDHILSYISSQVLVSTDAQLVAFYEALIQDGFRRLMKNTITGEIRYQKKEEADETSIKTFAANLRELLLSSPAGLRPTLGIDPGFRTGCKVAVLDQTGKYLDYIAIFPHSGKGQREKALATIKTLVQKYSIDLIAIGNGTASRETDAFVGEALQGVENPPIKVLVNEAGASVYSASEVAIDEFPDLDVTVRGAISIGRRLQDPLAELVKIDAKSIGVGQYQHDVDQVRLREKLEETVESCVNFVGVNLNTASKELLQFTSGITPGLAKSIVEYRNANGLFNERADLLNVPRFGPKAYEQAAGFLRIPEGKNPLDNTSVHPERYEVVAQMASTLSVALDTITRVPEKLQSLDLKRYVTDDVGLPTLTDILEELRKPGRDPREAFTYATFREDVKEMKDLQTGMILEGSVTNVTNFGAFVDIGVHRDGLVHVSQMANRFVKDPTEVVKVGQVVEVRVTEVNLKLKRIGLSMRLEDSPKPTKKPQSAPRKKKKSKPPKPQYSLEDLKAKFNTRSR